MRLLKSQDTYYGSKKRWLEKSTSIRMSQSAAWTIIRLAWPAARRQIPVIFAAVSRDADHRYVFVQDKVGPCIGCLFPDSLNDDRYPRPGTPAIADVLQVVGSFAVYAVDTLVLTRARKMSIWIRFR